MTVFPAWLNQYRPDVYQNLVAKENWSYTNQGQTGWAPLFQQLADELNSWQAVNRRGAIEAFMLGTYGYLLTGIMYGTDTSLKSQMSGYGIYNANSFLDLTMTRPVDYYNDLVLNPTTGGYSSANMTGDLDRVKASNYEADNNKAKGFTNLVQGTLQDHMYIQLFQTLPIQGTASKSQMAQTYFIDLLWKPVYQYLNVGGLPLPPGI